MKTPPCAVHLTHSPRDHVPEVHHIWPQGMGGPDTARNRVSICATGHNNVHHLLALWVKTGGEPPWSVRRSYTPAERALAERGYQDSRPPTAPVPSPLNPP